MRMRKKPWAIEEISVNPFVVQNANEFYGKWRGLFKREKPIHIEIGTGKGRFIIEKAESEPDTSFIGIERQISVLASAARNISGKRELPNIKLVYADANALSELFSANEVSRIYINFCDPWPKKKWEKRRLTHCKYLKIYEEILESKGVLDFKTDSRPLFQFTMDMLAERGWAVKNAAVRNSPPNDGNGFITEYEERFLSLGMDIYEIAAEAPCDKFPQN